VGDKSLSALHAALAEIRDTLLETHASNDAMNQLLLSQVDLVRAQPAGQKQNPSLKVLI